MHPDDNEPILTNFGRFGPYVKHHDEFRIARVGRARLNISLDAALALLRAPEAIEASRTGRPEEDAEERQRTAPR